MHSALITAYLAKGLTVSEAQSEAKIHVANLIESGYSIGGGTDIAGIPQPSYSPQELEVLEDLETTLHGILDIFPVLLVPEVGTNFGYALPIAETLDDVCALEGRLIRVGNSIEHLGGLKFGASRHIARIILTAMKFSPETRSAMNIKYSPEIIERIHSLDLTISSFDRNSEPKDTSSMEWGTEVAIRKSGSVPDIIYDEGGIGKEPMIRILGKDPSDVHGKLKKIVDKYSDK
jgi:hydroxymethylpyrimidine/phosphomethylpyrimidine kinase